MGFGPSAVAHMRTHVDTSKGLRPILGISGRALRAHRLGWGPASETNHENREFPPTSAPGSSYNMVPHPGPDLNCVINALALANAAIIGEPQGNETALVDALTECVMK